MRSCSAPLRHADPPTPLARRRLPGLLKWTHRKDATLTRHEFHGTLFFAPKSPLSPGLFGGPK